MAGVWAAVIDVGLAVGPHVASNTRTPVSTGAIVSAGSSVLAGAAALTGEEVCVCGVSVSVYMLGRKPEVRVVDKLF